MLLGFIGVVFAGSLGVTGNLSPGAWPVRLLAGLAVVALLVAGVLAAQAYLPREIHQPPNVRTLRTRFLTRPSAESKLAIVDELLWAYDSNKSVIVQKLGAYRRAQSSFVVSVIFLAVAIVLRLLTGG